jgi:hypothetical protein
MIVLKTSEPHFENRSSRRKPGAKSLQSNLDPRSSNLTAAETSASSSHHVHSSRHAKMLKHIRIPNQFNTNQTANIVNINNDVTGQIEPYRFLVTHPNRVLLPDIERSAFGDVQIPRFRTSLMGGGSNGDLGKLFRQLRTSSSMKRRNKHLHKIRQDRSYKRYWLHHVIRYLSILAANQLHAIPNGPRQTKSGWPPMLP